jgi:hypothetical protein
LINQAPSGAFFTSTDMPSKQESFAFDRASVRKVDVDGRLHVEISNISKANVCPYAGKEIPNAAALGLQPDRIYMLLRDPEELQRAASTFNNIPLLSKHVPVSADEPQKELIVGSTGTDAVFEAPYLKNSLVVWDAVAIAGIETKEQTELSSAYRYTADMTPGTFEGTPYDGVMRNIQGNHVALVEVGRAGPDVVVGDSNPFFKPMEYKTMKASRKAIAVRAALGAYLRPALAQDAAIVDLGALVRGVKAATIAQDKARIVKAVQAKIKDVNAEELERVIQIAADEEPDDEKDDKKGKPAEDEDDEEEVAKKKKEAEDEDEEDDKKDKKDKEESKAAMDSAIKSAVAATEKATIQRMNAIRAAEKEVQPFIGEVVAQDSAEAVYKLALDHAGIDLTGVHPSAYGAMVRMLPKPGDIKQPRVAMDAVHADDFAKRFPTAGKLVRS